MIKQINGTTNNNGNKNILIKCYKNMPYLQKGNMEICVELQNTFTKLWDDTPIIHKRLQN